MSFLDNLENSLKSPERQDERDTSSHQGRQSDRAAALARAPWAEKLKTSPYTNDLMGKAAEASHRLRAKIYPAWMEDSLRLELRGHKLELRPTANGIDAVFLIGLDEVKSQKIDLDGDASALLNEWLGSFDLNQQA